MLNQREGEVRPMTRVRRRLLKPFCALALFGLMLAGVTACSTGDNPEKESAPATASHSDVQALPTTTIGGTRLPAESSASSVSAVPTSAPAPVVTTSAHGADVVGPLSTPVEAPVDQNADEPVIVLGTIEIPKIGVSEKLYEGIRLTTFDRGPGHWPGTAMPGQFGNAVVGGHRTSHTKPFRHLDDLGPGDEVIFTTDAGRFVYHVDSTEIITPDVTRVVNQNPGFTATLFACNPVGSTRQRIIVHLVLSNA